MSVIADFSIPANEFALGHLLEVRPGVKIRLESMIPTGESVIPYFWVEEPDIDAVEEALSNSRLVEDVKVVDNVGDEALFRVTWSEEVNGVIDTIIKTHSVILGGTGHGDHWTFEVRFPEYDELSEFYRSVVDKDIPIEVNGIHNPVEHSGPARTKLTEEQRDALMLAFESGYFEIPREITLVELADRLDISDSAVSQRIRRGLRKLLSTGLAAE